MEQFYLVVLVREVAADTRDPLQLVGPTDTKEDIVAVGKFELREEAEEAATKCVRRVRDGRVFLMCPDAEFTLPVRTDRGD